MTAHRGKFVAYYRVSTDRQGQSGLGLDAQQKAVLDYLNGGSWTLAGEFTEVEVRQARRSPTARRSARGLQEAEGEACHRQLDRLSRNLAFIAALMDSGVEFVAADNPHANKLTRGAARARSHLSADEGGAGCCKSPGREAGQSALDGNH